MASCLNFATETTCNDMYNIYKSSLFKKCNHLCLYLGYRFIYKQKIQHLTLELITKVLNGRNYIASQIYVQSVYISEVVFHDLVNYTIIKCVCTPRILRYILSIYCKLNNQ